MNAEKEILEIDKVINKLNLLKTTLKRASSLSEKNSKINPFESSPSQIKKASAALSSELIHLDLVRRDTWRAIKENEYLEVSLEDKTYYLSGFHTFKI